MQGGSLNRWVVSGSILWVFYASHYLANLLIKLFNHELRKICGKNDYKQCLSVLLYTGILLTCPFVTWSISIGISTCMVMSGLFFPLILELSYLVWICLMRHGIESISHCLSLWLEVAISTSYSWMGQFRLRFISNRSY